MADLPLFSSPGNGYQAYRSVLDQENITSSPLASREASSNSKPRRPPTVTPNRFTKFFTPRNSLSTRGQRQSKASRRLQDITKNAANRRTASSLKARLLDQLDNDHDLVRPYKRRKPSFDVLSSPPQSSPIRKNLLNKASPEIFLDDPDLSSDSEAQDLPESPEDPIIFPQPVRRTPLWNAMSCDTGRLLQRSFGGYDAVGCGWKGLDHGGHSVREGQAADFISRPQDRYNFKQRIIPFCATSCNTNSLIAIGEEEGGVRLLDSASTADFGKKVISFSPHRNSVMDMSFNSDDFRLATASGDQTVRITDMCTQQTLSVCAGHTSSVKQVKFQPDNDAILVSSGRDGTVLVWDLRCSDKNATHLLRSSTAPATNAEEQVETPVRYPTGNLPVGTAHRVARAEIGSARRILNSDTTPASVTAIQHLGTGREHLLVTATELDSSLRLWDLRNASRRQASMPLSMTPIPLDQSNTRNFGINSLALSGDGARLYALSRNAAVYAYATNHLVNGSPPEMNIPPGRRRIINQPSMGSHPTHAFRSPDLKAGSFYCRVAVRKARNAQPELLAVGSPNANAEIFSTDERFLKRPRFHAPEEWAHPNFQHEPVPTHCVGTSLSRGHSQEVTAVVWTHDGDLVTVSDDLTVRCWREDAGTARYLRRLHEGSPLKYGYGYANSSEYWDCSDEEEED